LTSIIIAYELSQFFHFRKFVFCTPKEFIWSIVFAFTSFTLLAMFYPLHQKVVIESCLEYVITINFIVI